MALSSALMIATKKAWCPPSFVTGGHAAVSIAISPSNT